MGIAGLATRLEPYAARCTYEELQGYVAIIDGPALAYFAHKTAAESQSTGLPSYADINATALRWLDHLESSGIKVSAILFDGALPPSKQDERSSRLLQMVKRVTQFHSMHANVGCPIPSQLGSVAYPFLAPSLREALSLSTFSHSVRVVPGEADDWCASHAQNHPRSIVFTSDTDLLLYDYPEDVLINFLKESDSGSAASLKVYSPSRICQQLDLKSLVQLAYAIQNDRWKTLANNVKDARLHHDEKLFIDFRKRYRDEVSAPALISREPRLLSSLQPLDARVSEFVVQSLSAATGEPSLTLPVFLPLLLEDPFRASAWTFGQNVRLVAYSLLAPARVTVQEHMRKAQAVSVQDVHLYGPENIISIAAGLSRKLGRSYGDGSFSPARRWMLCAVELALDTLKPPHISLLARVVTGTFDNTWAFVHLQACLHAMLYSLRMLKQCAAVWLALNEGISLAVTKDQIQTISDLHHKLETLPPLAELFTIPGQKLKERPEDAGLLGVLKHIYFSAGIADEELFQEAKSKKQRKREKRNARAQAKVEAPKEKPASSNVFSLLGPGIWKGSSEV
ncbi:hypothetical protein M011DRAFT_404468 [Sporormia fimetaria CBS 119925]|uniref:Asteroid domain-containing protein n=1 Tax=Sporormia fimetaria CBS 119925 TaxID=1340428 RepID=A0A6A6VA12_9PLEO|nr:hypothetical protein M011DRAFT_404468 [Sporormia fimetaria CBS 119925]